MKLIVLPQPVGFLKLMQNKFVQVLFKWENSTWLYGIDVNIILCLDTCEAICFKVGMMLNTTEVYSLIQLWMTVMFTQGHKVTGKLEFVQSSCCKVAWSNLNVHDGWLCKGVDCEEILQVWQIWIVGTFALLVYSLMWKYTFLLVHYSRQIKLVAPLPIELMIIFPNSERISWLLLFIVHFGSQGCRKARIFVLSIS